MSLETYFNIKSFGAEKHILLCQRCKNKRSFDDFWDGDRSMKLCSHCRDYNKKYLRKVLDSEILICPRCRHTKDIADFFKDNKRLKLCTACREYNRQYQQKR